MRPSDIERQWPGVRIGDIEMHSAEGAQQIVRACVHLGALLPVDVHVELLCAEDRIGAGESPHSSRHEMWSVQSYDNGTFSYEGHIPASALEGKLGCAIRVTSTARNVDPSEVPPVIRWLPPHDTGQERRADHLFCAAEIG